MQVREQYGVLVLAVDFKGFIDLQCPAQVQTNDLAEVIEVSRQTQRQLDSAKPVIESQRGPNLQLLEDNNDETLLLDQRLSRQRKDLYNSQHTDTIIGNGIQSPPRHLHS